MNINDNGERFAFLMINFWLGAILAGSILPIKNNYGNIFWLGLIALICSAIFEWSLTKRNHG